LVLNQLTWGIIIFLSPDFECDFHLFDGFTVFGIQFTTSGA